MPRPRPYPLGPLSGGPHIPNVIFLYGYIYIYTNIDAYIYIYIYYPQTYIYMNIFFLTPVRGALRVSLRLRCPRGVSLSLYIYIFIYCYWLLYIAIELVGRNWTTGYSQDARNRDCEQSWQARCMATGRPSCNVQLENRDCEQSCKARLIGYWDTQLQGASR